MEVFGERVAVGLAITRRDLPGAIHQTKRVAVFNPPIDLPREPSVGEGPSDLAELGELPFPETPRNQVSHDEP